MLNNYAEHLEKKETIKERKKLVLTIQKLKKEHIVNEAYVCICSMETYF